VNGRTLALALAASLALGGGLLALRRGLSPEAKVEPAPSAPRRSTSVDPERSAKLAELREKAKKRTATEERVAQAIEQILATYLQSPRDAAAANAFRTSIVALLERENLGNARSRIHVARRTLAQLPDDLSDPKRLAEVSTPTAVAERAGKLATYVTYVAKEETSTKRAAPPREAPDGVTIVRWETIGDFEYEEGMKLPEEVLALDGKRVALSGYMDSMGELASIKEFVLSESVAGCCFGTPPGLNQLVLVNMKSKKGVAYSDDAIVVVGTLRVGELRDGEFVTSLFRLEATEVKPGG
jgi:hypothetical protein